MIKKLHRKFILINMLFVSSIMAAVLGVFYYSAIQRLHHQTEMAVREVMEIEHFDRELEKQEPGRPRPDPFPLPSAFIITVDSDSGQIADRKEINLSVSQELAESLAAQVIHSGNTDGFLEDYSLRYHLEPSPDGTKIAFIDQSYQIAAARGILITCILVFFIAMVLFFFLSLFLSRWALKPVKTAWQQQNQFIADASHELKTPLTVILANLQILSAHKDSTIKSQEKWLENTREEAKRMKKLVEGLLFLARSDAGVLTETTPHQMLDFSDSVLNCVLLFESVAFEQKVKLTSSISPDISLSGSEAQLKQLVLILLDNACKYAGKNGAVNLELKKSPHNACLTVQNTGDPIPLEEQKHIFERFYRTDKSRVRKEAGYGLGLSIARTIVEHHKGKIIVSSNSEEGTIFTVSLPL